MDFEITSPQGEKFVITAPEGASQEQVLRYAQENFKTPEKAPQQPKWYEIEKQPGLPKTLGGAVKQIGNQFMQGLSNPMPGSLISTPIRALQETAGQAGADVARGLINKGANPVAARIGGFGTSAALDPTSYVGGLGGAKAGMKAAQGVADIAGQEGAALASGASNVPISSIKKFFQNPMAVFKSPNVKEAGAILQKAKEIAGVTREEEFLIAKAADRSVGGARSVAEELRPLFEKDPTSLTVGQLMALNRASGKLAGEAKGSEKALWSGVKAQAQQALEKQASKIAEGLEQYALSKTKGAFMSLFPKTKAGRADYFKTIGAGLTFGLTSPLAVGLGTLVAKGASKLVKPVGAAVGAVAGFPLSQLNNNKAELDKTLARLRNAK